MDTELGKAYYTPTFELTAEDYQTIRMALKKRIDSLWSIEMSDRQKELRTRYKLLFEKIGGDYNQSYEYEYLKGKEV